VFDIVASLIGLIALSPLFVLIAILIKITSRGTIFYVQERTGKDNKHFTIYKFRSMYMDIEKVSNRTWSMKNDDRAFPFGKFLRKTHLDELPQLVNIVKGEMSVVSPRPERPMLVEKFKKQISEYDKRLIVRPGLTGLAQISQRADESIEDVKRKLQYDQQYIEKQSILYDLQIIYKTMFVVFGG